MREFASQALARGSIKDVSLPISAVILAKPARAAKARLSPALPPVARQELAAAMLADLLDALKASACMRTIAVQTADPGLGDVAIRAGADWYRETFPSGLNEAAAKAMTNARHQNMHRLLILPSDLPLARACDFEALAMMSAAEEANMPIGVRSRDGGTNALLLDPGLNWRFAFGPNSYAAHEQEAARLGLMLRAAPPGNIAEDIDTPADLALARAQGSTGRTAILLNRHLGAPAPERSKS